VTLSLSLSSRSLFDGDTAPSNHRRDVLYSSSGAIRVSDYIVCVTIECSAIAYKRERERERGARKIALDMYTANAAT